MTFLRRWYLRVAVGVLLAEQIGRGSRHPLLLLLDLPLEQGHRAGRRRLTARQQVNWLRVKLRAVVGRLLIQEAVVFLKQQEGAGWLLLLF